MKVTHIKESVKNRTHKGNLNSRTHYRITLTEQHKTIIANRKHKLSIRDNNNGIDKDTRDFIINKWCNAGYTLKDFYSVGVVKALQYITERERGYTNTK